MLPERKCAYLKIIAAGFNDDLKGPMMTGERLKRTVLKITPFLGDAHRRVRNRVNSLNVQLKKYHFSTKCLNVRRA